MGVTEVTVEDIVEHNEAVKTQCLHRPQWDVPRSTSTPRPSSQPQTTDTNSSPSSHPQQGTVSAPAFPFNEVVSIWDGLSKSERQDAEWARLTSTSASDPNSLSFLKSSSEYSHGPKGGASAYTLGSLTGSWRGTLLVSLFLPRFRIIIIPSFLHASLFISARSVIVIDCLAPPCLIVCMTMWHRLAVALPHRFFPFSFLLSPDARGCVYFRMLITDLSSFVSCCSCCAFVFDLAPYRDVSDARLRVWHFSIGVALRSALFWSRLCPSSTSSYRLGLFVSTFSSKWCAPSFVAPMTIAAKPRRFNPGNRQGPPGAHNEETTVCGVERALEDREGSV